MELATIYVMGSLIALVVAVLWIALPFAIFGTKPILEAILREARTANAHREATAKHNKALLDEAELTSQRLLEVKMAIEVLTKFAERAAHADTTGPRSGV